MERIEETETKQPTEEASQEATEPKQMQEATEPKQMQEEPEPKQPQKTPETEQAQKEKETAVKPLTEAETIRLQGYYIVQKGETLVAISRKIYGDTKQMKDICAKNGIENSDEIYAGQKLLLP